MPIHLSVPPEAQPIPLAIDGAGRFEATVTREGAVVIIHLRSHLPRPGARLALRLAPTCARELATALGHALPRRARS
jgi:hypothetical protein